MSSKHINCFRASTAHIDSHTTSYIEHALSSEENNDEADGHRYSFAWFNDLGRSVIFFF